jgi:hypothetical protein
MRMLTAIAKPTSARIPATINEVVMCNGGLETPRSRARIYSRCRAAAKTETKTPTQTMPNPSHVETAGFAGDAGLPDKPNSRVHNANRAMTNPNPIRDMEVRTQARNVRSAARYTRGSLIDLDVDDMASGSALRLLSPSCIRLSSIAISSLSAPIRNMDRPRFVCQARRITARPRETVQGIVIGVKTNSNESRETGTTIDEG